MIQHFGVESEKVVCPSCSSDRITIGNVWHKCRNCELDGTSIMNGYLIPETRRYRLCSEYYHVDYVPALELKVGQELRYCIGRRKDEHLGVVVAIEEPEPINEQYKQFLLKTGDKIIFVISRHVIKEAYEQMGSLEEDSSWKPRRIKIID